MLSFESDYTEGAHEKILEQLIRTNRESLSGYGSDPYCESAAQKIRQVCESPDADVYFLVGGTQANMVITSALLRGYEGVVSAQTGHVNTHEAGALEGTGHKVLPIRQKEGKLEPQVLKTYLAMFFGDANHEHMVFPGLVYISHPTELGTLYTKAELEALSAICRAYKIPLYLDGARLGYGLMSEGTDVTLPVIAECCDAFYIGGTKMGALCGEAVVFPRHGAPAHFLTTVKQHGALLAKGRLLGVQFDAMFTGGLYFEMGRHAIAMARRMKEALLKNGYTFYVDSPTNQQFVVLENEKMDRLSQQVRFSFWERLDERHAVVRFATSWATREADIAELETILSEKRSFNS